MTFEQWRAYANTVRARAERIRSMIVDRAFAMASASGISPDCVCIHNAALDEDLSGWCYRNPERLKIAKRANHLLDNWQASTIADRLIDRAWRKVTR